MLNLLPLPAAGPLRLVTLHLLKDLFSLCGGENKLQFESQ